MQDMKHPQDDVAEEWKRRPSHWASPPVPTCPFHADRAAVRNGMCEPCAEMADDAR